MSGGNDYGKQNHPLRFIHGIVVIRWDTWADFICDGVLKLVPKGVNA